MTPSKSRDKEKKQPRKNTRLRTDLSFEEAVKRLLNTPPPGKEPSPTPASRVLSDRSGQASTVSSI
jgi:hypothetical protein